MNPIKIWQPRWKDSKVLVARYRIAPYKDLYIEIEQSARKGIYKVAYDDVINSPIENMKTKNGKLIQMRAIPLEKLEAV